MADSSIKTILSIDDKDVKTKLKLLEKHYEETFKGMGKATDDASKAMSHLKVAQADAAKAAFNLSAAKQKGNEASKEEIKALQAQVNATNAAVTSAKKWKAAMDSNVSAIKQEMAATKDITKALNDGTSARKASSLATDKQFNDFIRLARWGGTLAGVYYSLSTIWGTTIGKGIELGRQIEDMGMGISALTAANTSNVDSHGKVLNSMEKFQVATLLTSDAMSKLKKVAIETPGTFTELSAIFQQAYVSTSKMGQGFGLTLKEVIANTIQLSGRMANIAGAIGMPMAKALEETRSLMSGQASGDSLIASLLFGSPAQANEAMRKAKTQGPLGVKQMLDGVMQSFDALAKVDTYTKALNNMQGAYDNLVTTMSAPIKDDLQETFKKINEYLSPERIQEFSDTFKVASQVAGDSLDIIASSLGNIGKAAFLVGNQISLSVGKASGDAVANFNFFDYFILGIQTSTLAFNTFINYMETEFNRSSLVVQKYYTWLNKTSYIPIVAKDKWNGKNVVTTMGTIQRAKLDMQIAASDQDMTSRTDKGLNKLIDTYNNLKAAKTNYLKKPRASGGSGGDLQTELLDTNVLADALKNIAATETSIAKNGVTRKANLAQITILEKEIAKVQGESPAALQEIAKYQGQINTFRTNIARLNAEDTKDLSKLASKAESQHNKEARVEISAFARLKQRQEEEIAHQELLDMEKIGSFTLDETNLTVIQKIKLNHYAQNDKALTAELEAAEKLDFAHNRENEVSKAKEAIYKNFVALGKERLSIQSEQVAKLEKEQAIAGKLMRKQLDTDQDAQRFALKKVESYRFEEVFGKDKISQATAIDAEAKAWDKLWEKAYPNSEEFDLAFQQTEQHVLKIQSMIADIPDIQLNVSLTGYDDFSNALAQSVNAFTDLNKEGNKYNLTLAEMNARGEDTTDLSKNHAQAQLQGYASMTAGMSSFYKAESKEAKRLHEVEKALNAAKMVMQLTDMATSTAFTGIFVAQEAVKTTAAGTTAVAIAAQSSPWTGLITAAAMIAMLASIGIMLGGGGSGSTSISSDAFSAQAANTGTGSVLGDSEAQSESIKNSLSLLKDLAKPQFRLTSQMAKSLESIDQKMGGVSSLLIQQGGFAVGIGANEFSSISNSRRYDEFKKQTENDPMSRVLAKSDFIGLAAAGHSLAQGIIGSIIGGLFGKKSVDQALTDSGISFADTFLLSAIDQLDGQSFQTISTTITKKSWFKKSSSTSIASYFTDLNSETERQFSLVLSGLYDITLFAGEALDSTSAETTKSLENFVVSIGKISLKGKTGEQIQETLTAVFGKIGDDIAKTAFPALIPFQKIGEGMFETMTRVASGMEEAGYYIDRLGSSFQKVTYTSINNKQGDVALEALSQSITAVDEAAYGANNGVLQMLASFTGSVKDLFETYNIFEVLRGQLTSTGKDARFLTSTMIMGAGGINELGDAMGSYFTNYLSESEQVAYQVSAMEKEFAKLNIMMPIGKDGFRALVDGIDISTESGQELYGRLLLLGNQFEATTSGVDKLSAAFKSLGDTLQQTIDKLLGNQTGATSQQAQIDDFWTQRGEAAQLLSKGTLTDAERKQLETIISGLSTLSLSIQSGSTLDNTGITQSLVSELYGLKANLPSYAVGSAFISSDQTANIHKGEMVIDAQSSSVLRKYGVPSQSNSDLVAPILANMYDKISEMTGYMKRLDSNFDSVVFGRALRTVAS